MSPHASSFIALSAFAVLVAWLPAARRRASALAALRVLVPVLVTYTAGLLFTHVVADRAGVSIRESDVRLFWSGAALPVLPVALCWRRVRVWVAIAMCGALGLLALTDILTLRGIDTLPSVVTMTGVGNVWSVRHSIWDLVQPADAVVLLLPLCGLCLLPLARRAASESHQTGQASRARVRFAGRRRRQQRRWLVVGALPAVACVITLYPLGLNAASFMDSRFSWKVFRVTDWVRSGVVTAHVYDTLRSLRELGQAGQLSGAEQARVVAYYQARAKRVPVSATTQDFGLARGANVLIVQVEALQQWVIDARFRGQYVMPFLNGLRRQGAVYFSQIFDQTGPAATTNCEYAVLASQHPLAVGATAFRRPNDRFVSLPRVLKQHGYGTYSAHAFHRGYWNRASFHPSIGIDTSFFRRELGTGERFGWGLSDEVFLQRALSRLERAEQPLFGMFVTLTSHHPYRYIPARKRKLRQVVGLGSLGGYLHSMRYVDDALKRFFKRLGRSKLADNTMVVVYGDHDSRLRIGGSRLRSLQRAMPDRRDLLARAGKRDWTADKVPLLFVLPKRARTGQVDTVGGQINVAPTILHYLGIPRPSAFLGHSLVPTRPGFVARMDGAVATRGAALRTSGKDRCVDLAGRPQDPKACAGLAERAQQELSMSWAVTLNDLFPLL